MRRQSQPLSPRASLATCAPLTRHRAQDILETVIAGTAESGARLAAQLHSAQEEAKAVGAKLTATEKRAMEAAAALAPMIAA